MLIIIQANMEIAGLGVKVLIERYSLVDDRSAALMMIAITARRAIFSGKRYVDDGGSSN